MLLLHFLTEAHYYAKKEEVFISIFPEVSGYIVPNIIRFYQNYILWGPFSGKNIPL